MNRRFRLAAVEQMRAGAVAEAVAALATARQEVAAALADHGRIRRELAGTGTPSTSTPAEHEAAAWRRQYLRDELVRAGERCAAARDEEESALSAWSSARTDLRAVEMLHERHRAALAEADARADQRETDEFAALAGRRATDGDLL
jgi:flagellar export protein FliJ